jgi:hypothetical protein
VPFVAGPIPAMDKCVEACAGMGWDPDHCVTENAVTAATSSSPSTASASVAMTSTLGTAAPSETKAALGLQFAGGRALLSITFFDLVIIAIST